MSGDVVARAKELLAYEDGYPVNTCGKHTGRASNRCLLAAGHDGAHDDDPPPLTFPDSLAAELVAEIEKLRRGGKELGRIIERQCLDVLEITGLHHMIDADGDGDWGVVWERLAEMAAAGAEVEKLRGAMDNHQATIFQIQEARVDYNAALNRREHGAVAADHFMRNVFSALDIHAAVIERAGIEP